MTEKIPDARGTMIPPHNMVCPSCATNLVVAAAVGDCCICIVCRAMFVIDAEFEVLAEYDDEKLTRLTRAWLRHPTEKEETTWLADARVQGMIRFVAEYHAKHGSPSPVIDPPDGEPPHPPF